MYWYIDTRTYYVSALNCAQYAWWGVICWFLSSFEFQHRVWVAWCRTCDDRSWNWSIHLCRVCQSLVILCRCTRSNTLRDPAIPTLQTDVTQTKPQAKHWTPPAHSHFYVTFNKTSFFLSSWPLAAIMCTFFQVLRSVRFAYTAWSQLAFFYSINTMPERVAYWEKQDCSYIKFSNGHKRHSNRGTATVPPLATTLQDVCELQLSWLRMETYQIHIQVCMHAIYVHIVLTMIAHCTRNWADKTRTRQTTVRSWPC